MALSLVKHGDFTLILRLNFVGLTRVSLLRWASESAIMNLIVTYKALVSRSLCKVRVFTSPHKQYKNFTILGRISKLSAFRL